MNGTRCRRWTVALLFALLVCGLSGRTPAADETSHAGQAALNEALQLKVSADSLADLNKVIQLCETALKEGLSETNEAFCKQLLAATLLQRGTVITEAIFSRIPPDPRWPEFRKLALADLERSIELEPREPDGLLQIARLHRLPGGDAQRAKEAVDKAIEFTADNRKLLARAYILRASMQDEPSERLQDLTAALNAVPGEVEILRARGALLADMGKYQESLDDLSEAIKMDPEDLPTLQVLALVLQKMGRDDDAIQVLEQALMIEPGSLQILIEKARVLALAEQWDAAIDVLDQADKRDPGNMAVLLLRASIHEQQGDLDKAIADIERVLRVAPDFPLALRLHIALLAQKGDFPSALAGLKKLEAMLDEAGESDPAVTLQFGLVYSAMKEYDKAIQSYAEALRKDPDNVVALRGRADALLGLGKQSEAKADYERALELVPDDAGVLNNLSWLLSTSPREALRDGPRALELAKQAAEHTDYEQAHILSTLAAAYAELGDFDQARHWARKAVEAVERDKSATDEMREALRKELESFEKGRPWREVTPGVFWSGDDSPEEETERDVTPPAE